MPLFGKSASEIDERRAVKRRFVELCVACAKIAPLAMTGNGVLSGSQTGNVTVAAGEFFTSLSEPEKVALRSAKGCDKPPDEAKQKEYLTLADFLKIPTLSVDGAGCMAAFVHDLIAWGHQVIAKNPNSFSPQDLAAFKASLHAALKDNIVPIEKYKINPQQYGDPADSEQAMYWLLMKLAGIVYGDCAVEVGDKAAALKAKPAATKRWNDVAKKQLAREYLLNPNIQALLGNYDKAYNLMEKQYGSYF